MVSRIKIKIGRIEFEYEGETVFTQDDIKDLFSHLEALAPTEEEESDADPVVPESSKIEGRKALHTSSIATRLKGKGASNLVLAAAAHLQIVEGKEAFTRQELISDMRSAKTHFNRNHVSNLSNTLNVMLGQKSLNQIGKDTYSLSASKHSELEQLIAE